MRYRDRLRARQVLDGISLAAFAVGADEAYLAVHGQNARLIDSLDAAIQARNVALIDPVPIQLVGLEDRYVASEQTAIVRQINSGPGLPTFSPRRTHERGVANRPTAVNNVETLADRTIDVHISWLRRKLGENAQQPRYLHTIRGVGIKLAAPA
jgi:NADH:ubiquinone oxidoreductase subunit F (NADH-binding)